MDFLNKIFNEDCLQTMSRMPDNYIDLTVTSPPYDGLRDYNGYSFPFEDIAKELYRVTKQGGVVVWVVNDSTKNGCESLTSFKQAIYFVEQCGFNLHDTMIYRKINYIPLTHNRYEQEFEYMFVLSKGKPKTFNPIKVRNKLAGKKYNPKRPRDYDNHSIRHNRDEVLTYKEDAIKGNIFEYIAGAGSDVTNHPAPFPEMLVGDMINSWSNEWELVYDCFMGSGTTAKIAHKLNRNWIGSEISNDYVIGADKRLHPHLAQTKIF